MTGLQTVPGGQAGVFSVMLPLTAASIGAFFFHEPLSALQAGAFAVALLGLLLATLPGRQTRAASV
jgi:drug/metabolite transporter (DMT)-like permease